MVHTLWLAIVLSVIGITSLFLSNLPLLLILWFSLFTFISVFFLLSDNSLLGGSILLVVEESITIFIVAVWWAQGGGWLLNISALAKAGIVPFHNWFLDITSNLSSESFIWIISLHNGPIVLFFSSTLQKEHLPLFLLSLTTGALVLLSVGELRNLLIVSSSNILSITLATSAISAVYPLFFLALYLATLWTSFSHSLESTLFLVGMIGVPPLWVFQLNWETLSLFGNFSSLGMLLVGIAGFTVLAYTRFLFIASNESLQPSESKWAIWLILSILIPVF